MTGVGLARILLTARPISWRMRRLRRAAAPRRQSSPGIVDVSGRDSRLLTEALGAHCSFRLEQPRQRARVSPAPESTMRSDQSESNRASRRASRPADLAQRWGYSDSRSLARARTNQATTPALAEHRDASWRARYMRVALRTIAWMCSHPRRPPPPSARGCTRRALRLARCVARPRGRRQNAIVE